MTSYVILTRNEEKAAYTLGPSVNASSAEQAVRKHASTAGAGTYVAIPAKTFKPVTVQVETVQRVTIGGAT